MKVDLTGKVLDPNGQAIGSDSLGRILASAMMQSSQGDALKMYCLAEKMYKNEPFEVDESDFKLIKDFAAGQNGLINLVKARLIQALDK